MQCWGRWKKLVSVLSSALSEVFRQMQQALSTPSHSFCVCLLCADHCRYTVSIANGRLEATRVGSKLNVTCDSGYIVIFNGTDMVCKNKHGFATFDLLPSGKLPFRCERKCYVHSSWLQLLRLRSLVCIIRIAHPCGRQGSFRGSFLWNTFSWESKIHSWVSLLLSACITTSFSVFLLVKTKGKRLE